MSMEFIERRILIGLIFEKSFAARVLPFIRIEFFRTKESKKIAQIALGVYKKYGDVVGYDVLTKIKKQHEAELLEQFVESITDDEKQINVDVLVDETVEYFRERALQGLADNITTALAGGNIEHAEKELQEFRPVSKEISLAIDPFSDEAIKQAFDYETERVVQYGGALGKLINEMLVRDGFFAIMAPEKRGKTWFLLDVVMRSWVQGFNVAYFEVGDMSVRRLLRRMYTWVVKNPVGWEGEKQVTIPRVNCALHLSGKCRLPIQQTGDVCVVCRKKNPKRFVPEIELITEKRHVYPMERVESEVQKFREKRKSKIKLSVHSAKSLKVSDIDSILKTWKQTENFVPDVIVVDYADILAAEVSREFRHQVEDIWARLRKLSMDWHSLVVTGTQSDAKGHDTELLQYKNFSEDKRKYAHVTGLIGLNQTQEEKERHIFRVNIIVAREQDFNSNYTVQVGYSFDIGRAYLFSI